MTVTLNEELLARIRRKPRSDALTHEECIAVNLFWRKGISVPMLAKIFRASKNTLYHRALTGSASSHPNPLYINEAKKINKLIDDLGFKKAWDLYITKEMGKAVDDAVAEEVKKLDTVAA